MVNTAQGRPGLTPKGERTRARIVEAAAGLIYERGVARTTLDDVRATAEVSGSQLYHYFADKDELVQAVIDHQADVIVGATGRADLGSAEGIHAWRDMIIAQARSSEAKGGCPLGSVAGQVAESDPQARACVAAGFERWSTVIGDGLRGLRLRSPVDRHRPGRPRPDCARRPARRAPSRAGATGCQATGNRC